MSKQCCVGNADTCPASSSCTMILRSACSHHSHKPTTVTEVSSGRKRVQRKSKHVATDSEISDIDIFKDTSQLGSLLESSLKRLALKSAKASYSVLKKNLYSNLELSHSRNLEVYDSDLLNSTCRKELQFTDLSVSRNSYRSENSFNQKCSDFSGMGESEYSLADIRSSKMSRTKTFNRSTPSSVRRISESETEDDIEISNDVISSDMLANRKTKSYVGVNSNCMKRNGLLRTSISNPSCSNCQFSNRDMYSPSNEHSYRHSAETRFDKFRWSLWRFLYLKVIKMIDFDVWCLSRINRFGKYKAISILLLPFLLYLIWVASQCESVSKAAPVKSHKTEINSSESATSRTSSFDVLSSYFYLFLSYLSSIFSSVWSFFVEDEEVSTSRESPCSQVSSLVSFITSSLSWIPNLMSSIFLKADEKSASYVKEPVSPFTESHLSKEQMKNLATEVLHEEFKMLIQNLQYTGSQSRSSSEMKEIEKTLQNEMKSLQAEFRSLTETLAAVRKDLEGKISRSATSESIATLTADHDMHINLLNSKIKKIENKLLVLESLKKCCDDKLTSSDLMSYLETYLAAALKNVVKDDGKSESQYRFFHEWLVSKFVGNDEVSNKLRTEFEKIKKKQQNINEEHIEKIVEGIAKRYFETFKENLTYLNSKEYFSSAKFSEEQIKKIVKEAIMIYDADKTGLTDFALESAGGSVVGTRCSETYIDRNGKFSILGVPLWSKQNTPRLAIQPSVNPGECWAFRGSQGFLVVELSTAIFPTGFSLEHIPVVLSPTGSIDSAPKDFSVWGLFSEVDSPGILLGSYSYDINGDPLQYFEVMEKNKGPFKYIELKIFSNHGNMEYTCLYRFRVHGKRA